MYDSKTIEEILNNFHRVPYNSESGTKQINYWNWRWIWCLGFAACIIIDSFQWCSSESGLILMLASSRMDFLINGENIVIETNDSTIT